MNDNNDIALRLATRLKSSRKNKGLSLDAVAKLSGVSKSMLSQIERGESSPTVATLWNLTKALQTDFSGLLDGDSADKKPIKDVVRAERTPTIDSRGEGCRIKILSAPQDVSEYEIYDISFDKNGALTSEPHSHGCTENLTVLEGSVLVNTGEACVDLNMGDTARYAGDLPHSIAAKGGNARVLLVVKSS
ncbi:MAG: helix-turn-helix domain-containing protein [Arenicella sp.]